MRTRVLIADDEALERRAIRKILETEPDLEFCEAENGVEALKLVAETNVRLVLLDIKMPGLDGIAVAERLRVDHPEVAVVFLTAYDQFDYARSALRLHVDDFLLKPASADEVVATVRALLARAASREDALESGRSALQRLENAIDLVTRRLRHDLVEGAPDHDTVAKFRELQGLESRAMAWLECRPAQPFSGLAHVARWAEAWFAEGAVALAAARPDALRVLLLGDADAKERIKRFREAARSATGCAFLVGAAVAAEGARPEDLVTSAHRAASLTSASNPIMVVSVGDGAEPAEAQNVPPAVQRALRDMEARLTEDLSLNEVAQAVGLSPSHLSRQLARATGRGFADCLAAFRVAAAKRYFADPGLTIKEVSHLVGFHDPAYFARVFRRLEGCSPADFRSGAAR